MSLFAGEALTKLKQAQNATDNAREATENARKNTRKLEAKLRKLEQEHAECKAALIAARATEEDAYTKYAQTVSRHFTTAFLSALPRELRDHVYSHLWDDEDIVRQTKRSIREYAWSYRMPEFCAPPYVQAAHVGQTVAEELALSIYKRAFGTRLHVTVSAGYIHKFLVANPLKSSLKPADSIRSLDIEWYPNEYSDDDIARSCQALSSYEFPEPIPIKLVLGKNSRSIDNKLETTELLANRLNVFRPAYDAMKGRGCPITIESLSGSDAEVSFFTN